jgi:hypothetical protein
MVQPSDLLGSLDAKSCAKGLDGIDGIFPVVPKVHTRQRRAWRRLQRKVRAITLRFPSGIKALAATRYSILTEPLPKNHGIRKSTFGVVVRRFTNAATIARWARHSGCRRRRD